MAEKTYIVLSGFTDRNGRHMHFLKGLDRAVEADTALPDGAAVRVVNGKAVRAAK